MCPLLVVNVSVPCGVVASGFGASPGAEIIHQQRAGFLGDFRDDLLAEAAGLGRDRGSVQRVNRQPELFDRLPDRVWMGGGGGGHAALAAFSAWM